MQTNGTKDKPEDEQQPEGESQVNKTKTYDPKYKGTEISEMKMIPTKMRTRDVRPWKFWVELNQQGERSNQFPIIY